MKALVPVATKTSAAVVSSLVESLPQTSVKPIKSTIYQIYHTTKSTCGTGIMCYAPLEYNVVLQLRISYDKSYTWSRVYHCSYCQDTFLIWDRPEKNYQWLGWHCSWGVGARRYFILFLKASSGHMCGSNQGCGCRRSPWSTGWSPSKTN